MAIQAMPAPLQWRAEDQADDTVIRLDDRTPPEPAEATRQALVAWSAVAADLVLHPDTGPPPELVDAIRAPQLAEFLAVPLDIDGERFTVVLDRRKPRYASDEELRVWWQLLLRSLREAAP